MNALSVSLALLQSESGTRESLRLLDVPATWVLVLVVLPALFLISYLYYHYQMKQAYGAAHTKFMDPAWFRPIYLVILFTHLVGAIAIVPLVLLTVTRAARQKFELHKKIARWTWPIWMYVSVTGVVIYFLLYQIFPQQ